MGMRNWVSGHISMEAPKLSSPWPSHAQQAGVQEWVTCVPAAESFPPLS